MVSMMMYRLSAPSLVESSLNTYIVCNKYGLQYRESQIVKIEIAPDLRNLSFHLVDISSGKDYVVSRGLDSAGNTISSFFYIVGNTLYNPEVPAFIPRDGKPPQFYLGDSIHVHISDEHEQRRMCILMFVLILFFIFIYFT